MNKFCGTCGSPIDPNTGLCPNCKKPNPNYNTLDTVQPTNYDIGQNNMAEEQFHAEEKAFKKQAWENAKKRYKEDCAAKKQMKKSNNNGKKNTRIIIKLLIILLIITFVAVGAYFIITGFFSNNGSNNENTNSSSTNSSVNKGNDTPGGSIGKDNPPDDDMPDEFEVSKPDADEYFNENSTIISEEKASNQGRTEAEAYKNLTERGFTAFPITAEYTMDGKYSEAKAISENSNTKHPVYTTYYVTEAGFVWVIYEINGSVFANPLSYYSNNRVDVQITFSETETITSYDSTLNKFYVTKPNESALKVKVIERIDSATLDTLTESEIDNL